MRRRRDAKGTLVDHGPSAVELPSARDVPPGWDTAPAPRPRWTPDPAVVFDPTARPEHVPVQRQTGAAAVTTILRFFNLRELNKRGQLRADQAEQSARLQRELREGPQSSGPRDWLRVAVDAPVHVGTRQVPARVTDISAGGMRIRDLGPSVGQSVMVGGRLEIRMPFSIASAKGTVVFESRVAWVNSMLRTMGLEFTRSPRWVRE